MFESILDKIKGKKVAVQLPEGLKTKWPEVLKELKDYEVIFLGDSCFGACDIRDHEAKESGADILIHVGHSHMGIKTEIPTLFVEYYSDLDISKVVEKAANEIVDTHIGILTTVQHLEKMNEARKILERYRKKVYVGKSVGRALHIGQLLGCDVSSATSIKDKVDCYLYIGTGQFHPVAVALETGKRVYIADPEKNEIREANELADKFLRQRFARIEKAKDAETFGILVSLKKGQKREKLAKSLKEMIEKSKKKAFLVAMNNFSPAKLAGFRADAYVSTACTRIAIDDASMYEKPLLTPTELEIVLGIREWVDYEMDRF